MFLFFSSDFKPHPGGIAEYVHQLCRHLAGNRLVITTVPCDPSEREVVEYPVTRVTWSLRPNCRFIDAFPPSRRALSLWWRFSSIRRIKRVLLGIPGTDEKKIVVITSWSLMGHWVAEACRRMRLPYSLIALGNELRYPLPPGLDRARIMDFRNAHTVIVISSYTRGIVESLGVPLDRIASVSPGIRNGDYTKVSSREIAELDCEFGLAGRRVLLSICRLVPRKGVDLALKAFAALKTEFPECVYVVAGEGSERERLMRIIRELALDGRVVFAGDVSHRTKCALLQRCELFIMPNRNLGDRDVEGFGIVFLEAGIYGKPVIGGRNGGAVDAVIDGETGLLVDTSTDYLPTATALRALLADPDRARRMGETGQERTRREFDWTSLADRFGNAVSDEVNGVGGSDGRTVV